MFFDKNNPDWEGIYVNIKSREIQKSFK